MWLSDGTVMRLRTLTEAPDLTGTRYEMESELGRGGMGVVYQVRDTHLDRSVAMKVVATELGPEAASLLEREARTVAALEHPGIVPLYDAGSLPDGRLFCTMKIVRGQRLDEWLRGEHSLPEKLRLFVRVCEPVAFAHARGVVHRDLKPENVMVGEFGAVLVMDWGVASLVGEHDRCVSGTPGYMAPEQARGESADAHADVFALGRILEVMLGDARERALRAIVARSCDPLPAGRYPDAGALARDVERHLDGVAVSAYRESLLEKAARWLSRNRPLVSILAAYILMRVIVFLWIRL